MKNGREAIIVAVVTGIFSSLALIVNSESKIFGIAVFVISIIAVYILINLFTRTIKGKIEDISSHPVFYTLEHFFADELTCIPIQNKKKKKLATLYLETKANIIKDILVKYLEHKDITIVSSSLLYINKRVSEEVADKIPKIFLDKMVEWDKKYNEWPIELINDIIKSYFYSDEKTKEIAVLDCIQVIVKTTVVAVENTLSSLNGDLDRQLGET
jgi:hypothetical protein